jgi:hypothetical protein
MYWRGSAAPLRLVRPPRAFAVKGFQHATNVGQWLFGVSPTVSDSVHGERSTHQSRRPATSRRLPIPGRSR